MDKPRTCECCDLPETDTRWLKNINLFMPDSFDCYVCESCLECQELPQGDAWSGGFADNH